MSEYFNRYHDLLELTEKRNRRDQECLELLMTALTALQRDKPHVVQDHIERAISRIEKGIQ